MTLIRILSDDIVNADDRRFAATVAIGGTGT